MTLTLEDVRNKRFRMARKSGYEVLEVDEFVDEVEVAFEQLSDENANLKKQIDALRSGSEAPAAAFATTGQPPAPAQPPLVVTTSKEASPAVVRLVELSTEQSERLVSEATADALRIREEADRGANEVTTDAQTRAERIESEARIQAEQLQNDATARAQALDREIDDRRREMVGDLERQRDQLSATVQALRSFEDSYRGNLTAHLREQISAVESLQAEPADAPEIPAPVTTSPPGGDGAHLEDETDVETTLGGSASSNTPRLDALLGDQR